MEPIPTVALANGVAMPLLGLGVWTMPDDETAANVQTAFASGYRLIDTAAAYQNEGGVGRAVRESGIPREEIFVTTKLWNADHGFDSALRAFDDSLARLGLETVDLYLIHWPVPKKGLAGASWKALERIHREGRARAIGVSNFSAAHLDALLADAEIVPAVNQIELHPAFPQTELRRYCDARGIRVESWFPLGGQRHKDALLGHPDLAAIGARHGKTAAQVVLRWHVQQGLVAIPKSSHPGRVRENREIFDFVLDADAMARIAALETGERFGPDPDTADF